MGNSVVMVEVGDQVVDRDAGDPDVMRVLRLAIGESRNVVVADLEMSVSELNPDYPEDDEVVETVYESWLDHHVPMWDEWESKKLAKELQHYSKTWNVPVRSYYYPASRLLKLDR